MKIIIELEGVRAVIEQKDAVGLDEVLPLIQQALLGVGFHFDGELNITEEEV